MLEEGGHTGCSDCELTDHDQGKKLSVVASLILAEMWKVIQAGMRRFGRQKASSARGQCGHLISLLYSVSTRFSSRFMLEKSENGVMLAVIMSSLLAGGAGSSNR